jgi:hypothetical protein
MGSNPHSRSCRAADRPGARRHEHVPQLRAITRGEPPIEDGHAGASDVTGLGIAWDRDVLDDLWVAMEDVRPMSGRRPGTRAGAKAG